MMNDHMNEVLRGNTLCSDGTDHQRLRRVIGKLLSPTALKSLQEEITSKAERLVERLVSKGTFCAITELATFLPMDIVASAGGLPRDGRERMLVWAAQMFNCFGPLNDRARGAFTDVARNWLGVLTIGAFVIHWWILHLLQGAIAKFRNRLDWIYIFVVSPLMPSRTQRCRHRQRDWHPCVP